MGSAGESLTREEFDRAQSQLMRILNVLNVRLLPRTMKTTTLRAAMLVAIGLVAVAGGLTPQSAFTTTEQCQTNSSFFV